MNTPIIILIVVLVVLYFWYVSIISKRNKVLEALSGIDVQLKKRSSLIPNILTIAKKFMAHEDRIFTEIASLREGLNKEYDKKDASHVKAHLANAGRLSQEMGSLMARFENYPELKSSQNMLNAQQNYTEVEEQIAAARRFYNASVTVLRNAIQIFPGNIIASLAGVKDMPLYEAEESAKASIDAEKFL